MSEKEISSHLDLGFIKGQIIDVIPVSVYEDKIHEQDIVFQFDNGIKLALSDNDLLCTKENIGQRKNIQITNGLRSSIEKCQNNRPEIGIFPYPLDQGPLADICGTLEKIVEPTEEKYKPFRRYATLNFGFGKIRTVIHNNHRENFAQFHEGDCVLIKGATLTLFNVSSPLSITT